MVFEDNINYPNFFKTCKYDRDISNINLSIIYCFNYNFISNLLYQSKINIKSS